MPSLTPLTQTQTSSLSGLAPCLFPRANRSSTATVPSGASAATGNLTPRAATAHRRPPPGTASARITLDAEPARLALQRLSSADPDGLAARLRVAWALLLRCYTGQDGVAFGVQTFGAGSSSSNSNSSSSSSSSIGNSNTSNNKNGSSEFRVAQVTIEEGLSLQETLQTLPRLSEPVAVERVEGVLDSAVVLWGFGRATNVSPCGPLAPVRSAPLYLFYCPVPCVPICWWHAGPCCRSRRGVSARLIMRC
jgi:hypothetical protein